MNIEFLYFMPDTSYQHRHSENQQDVADHGTGKRRLYDIKQAFFHCYEGDDELRSVPERCVQQTSYLLAAEARYLICAFAHQPGKRDYRKRTAYEKHGIRKSRKFSIYSHRYEYQQYAQIFHITPLFQAGRALPRVLPCL